MSNTPDVTETGNDTDAQTGRSIVTIFQVSALPGIPGLLSPGIYEIDYDLRTATPVVIDQADPDPDQPTPPDTTPSDSQSGS